jgi:putative ABC transport system ATP-binding protein
MIRLRGISKSYQMGRNLVKALVDFDLDISAGEFVSIVGKSGSGKSTLLNIIGCLDTPTSGVYELDTRDVSMLSDKELSVTRGQRIGFIFQNFNLIRRSTAIANVEKPLVYQGKNRRQRRSIAMQVLQRVGLEDRANHFPSQLSGGQQQRVAIARALVTNPSILIADEPTGNLDLATGNSIINFLHELHAEGRTVVLVTHDPGLAKQAQRTIVLEDGKIKK